MGTADFFFEIAKTNFTMVNLPDSISLISLRLTIVLVFINMRGKEGR